MYDNIMDDIRNKITGMILGVYIGDTMGIAVEGFSKDKIKEKYGRIELPQDPSGHPIFKDMPIGTYSDDTNFTIATAQSIISNKDLIMDSMAFHYISYASNFSCGMGGTTKKSISNLINGMHWSKSGVGSDNEIGNGNGPAMKVSPLAAYAVLKDYDKAKKFAYTLGKMTHISSNSVHTSICLFDALVYSLNSNKESFSKEALYQKIIEKPEYKIFDSLYQRLLNVNKAENLSNDEIIAMNNKGSFYAIDSIPFSLMFFYRNPFSFDSLIETVNSGGDVDTNASMVGALLGALNGVDIFPKNIMDSLPKEKINLMINLSDKLCSSLKD